MTKTTVLPVQVFVWPLPHLFLSSQCCKFVFTTQDSSQINNSSFPAPYPLASGSIFVCVALLEIVNMHFCKVYVWHSWTLFYAIKVQVVVTDRDMEKHFSTWALTG